jgi:hypothetical protein
MIDFTLDTTIACSPAEAFDYVSDPDQLPT